jgi:hypothetical protein
MNRTCGSKGSIALNAKRHDNNTRISGANMAIVPKPVLAGNRIAQYGYNAWSKANERAQG